jgi:low temperature requirement protein LtrA
MAEGLSPEADAFHHHIRTMDGRDPHEENRAATPLELLFDLTFVSAFSLASSRFAEELAAGRNSVALMGFGFASFAICWAWVNFSWFSSAYDTDDWIFRIATMVQMSGVLILATGLPRMYDSLEEGRHLDQKVMVLGYVVMRVAMVFQWLRAAKQDPDRRRTCVTYAAAISVAQIGWVALIFLGLPVAGTLAVAVVLALVEFAGPVLAERMGGTPWHAHHIVERHSLFAIIALGEGVVGTMATLSAVVEQKGWSLDAALVCAAGIGLTFGLWWVYYVLPSAQILHEHRERAFTWAYGQLILVVSMVATGAGLHVAALFIEQEAHISAFQSVLCVAIPVVVFTVTIYALYYYLVRRVVIHHVWFLTASAIVAAAAIGAAGLGVSMPICLVILMFSPFVCVLSYETLGYREQADALSRLAADKSTES